MTSIITNRPPLISYPTHILTLQDVIVDSPVFRSNVQHLEDQVDLFEKWLEGFIRVLKSYIDALTKVNTQTSHLFKQLDSNKMNLASIDSQVAGIVIHAFSGALESSLSAKVKLVNDLNETLLQPLQELLKTELKEFKDMRKTFEKTLDKYENHLFRYSNLSKQKEPSSLREDAFQMFDVQKSYIRASGTYFMQLITLKTKIEHTLVECFSGSLTDHLDHLDQSLQSQNSARTMIPGWRQWLQESKETCSYQLDRIEKSTRALEDAYIRKIRPHRSLKRYSTSNNDQLVAISNSSTFDSLYDDHTTQADSSDIDTRMASNISLTSTSSNDEKSSIISRHVKQGYLFSRITVGKPSRYSWVRRWFFLKDGWFGQCTISTVNKSRGTITINDRIPIDASCECRIFIDIDRRFCFQVNGSSTSFFLQAETELDMQQWLWAIERAKDFYGKDQHLNKSSTDIIPRALLSPKANTSIRKPLDDKSHILITLSSSPPLIPPITGPPATITSSPQATDYLANDVSTISAIITLMLKEGSSFIKSTVTSTDTTTSSSSSTTSTTDNDNKESSTVDLPSHQPSSTTTDDKSTNEQQESSIIPRRQPSTSTASSWSMPWLISGISALSSASADASSTATDEWILKSSNSQEPDALVIWPNKMELEAPKVTLNNYSDDLIAGQRELRRYFENVPKRETVLDIFSASLYRQTNTDATDNKDENNTAQDEDQKYQNKNNSFNDGKGYTGTVYVTQTKLWFYSCRMMTCVNAIVIPFNSIKTIRLEKVLSANSQGKLMYIETKQNPSSVFCFGLWLNAAELIAERIRVATENAKRTEKLDDQTLFDILRCTTIGKLKAKTPTSHVTTISASNAAVTPLTVQAQSRLTSEQQAIVGYASGSEESKSQSSSSASSSLSDNSGINAVELSLERYRNASPAAGALTAAMEAANEAEIAKSKTHKFIRRNSKLEKMKAKSMISATPTPDETTDDNLLDQKKQQQLDNMAATIPSSSAIQIPEGPVGCNCDDHLEKVEIDVEVPANVRTIYEFLVSTRCWEQLNKAKGNSVPNASNWEQTKTGTNERTLNYTMPNPMSKTKDADVIETQEILQQQHGSCYVMMITTKTPTLPYADAFIPMIKLCITFTSINSCRLVCSFGVKWLKSIMMKGMVNRAAVKGMSETITSLIPIVEQEASALQGKANVSGSANKQQMTQKERLTGIQEEDQVAAKQQSPLTTAIHGDTRQKGKLATSNILYRDTLLSPRWLAGFMGVALLFLLVNITWFTGRTRSLSTTNSMGNISWRAVHLTDLEPLVNGKDTEINRYNSSAYEIFKHSRSDIGGWDYYRWFNIRHRLIAAELTYTREQLAISRYELLAAFKMLNGMEQRLLESEYWNWLLDQRSRCDDKKDEDEIRLAHDSDNFTNKVILCNDINMELDQL